VILSGTKEESRKTFVCRVRFLLESTRSGQRKILRQVYPERTGSMRQQRTRNHIIESVSPVMFIEAEKPCQAKNERDVLCAPDLQNTASFCRLS
jgi:hypothetical protein